MCILGKQGRITGRLSSRVRNHALVWATSAPDRMISSYPAWKGSNSRGCEHLFRAVINVALRNAAGMQQIQALIWSDLMLPEQVIDPSVQHAARSLGAGALEIFRSLLQ